MQIPNFSDEMQIITEDALGIFLKRKKKSNDSFIVRDAKRMKKKVFFFFLYFHEFNWKKKNNLESTKNKFKCFGKFPIF